MVVAKYKQLPQPVKMVINDWAIIVAAYENWKITIELKNNLENTIISTLREMGVELMEDKRIWLYAQRQLRIKKDEFNSDENGKDVPLWVQCLDKWIENIIFRYGINKEG